MSKKPDNFFKRKLLHRFRASKSPTSTVSSSVYSGTASAERAIQKPGSPYTVRSNQTKLSSERAKIFAGEHGSSPAARYHSWESKYSKIFIREIAKKPMTKDPYTPKKHLIAHAKEKITTKVECHPVLASANAVHENQPKVHGEEKSTTPNSARSVQNKHVKPSERILPSVSMRKSSFSPNQVETKTPFLIIGTRKNDSFPPNVASTGHILAQVKLRNDASIIRKPASRVAVETIQETIAPLAV